MEILPVEILLTFLGFFVGFLVTSVSARNNQLEELSKLKGELSHARNLVQLSRETMQYSNHPDFGRPDGLIEEVDRYLRYLNS